MEVALELCKVKVALKSRSACWWGFILHRLCRVFFFRSRFYSVVLLIPFTEKKLMKLLWEDL